MTAPLTGGNQKMDDKIISEATSKLARLPYRLQEKALKYIDQLSESENIGVPGITLLKYVGCIPKEDLEVMQDAIERDCRQTDINEW